MFEEDLDPAAPYDNVEFPVRKSGTGTWPGSGNSSTPSPTVSSPSGAAGAKLFGTTPRGGAASSRLAPLVEIEGSESNENLAKQQRNFSSYNTSSTSSNSSQRQGFSFQNKMSTNANTATTTTNSTPLSSSTKTTTANTTSATQVGTTNTSGNITSTTGSKNGSRDTQSDKNSKPIFLGNETSAYVATQLNPAGDTVRKKAVTIKHEVEDDEFRRHDLDPASRLGLEKAYTQHSDFYQLNTKVLDEGSLLKQDVLDIYRKTGESLTYEQLLQGMLVDGERFLLSNCWLHFTHVQFLDVEGKKTLREPYGRGRIGLTSKRALFLSVESYTDASLEEYGDVKTPEGGYKLEVSKRNAVLFKNIPLNNFHSAEMEIVTGTSAQTKISKPKICCGCISLSRKNWISTAPTTRSINSRVLRVGVSMPPWQTRMFLDIHLDQSMSLTVARDFISQLHAFAPHMH